MRHRISFGYLVMTTSIISFGVSLLVTLTACQQASNNPARPPDSVKTPPMKPSRVSAIRVARETLVEVSRIERTLRPFLGYSDAPATELTAGSPYANCQTSKRISGSEWEIRWRCGLDSTESGKTEIEGLETTDFDRNTRILTTTSKFEIRTFDDIEPRSKAHTLQIRRTLTIALARNATKENFDARFRMKTQIIKKNIRPEQLGSDWTATTAGSISGKNGKWTLAPGLMTAFKGSLYGRGGERLTAWASGDYQMKSDSEIVLSGLTTGECTKPTGTWSMTGKAAGESFETSVVASDSGIVESSGSVLQWPFQMCDEP